MMDFKSLVSEFEKSRHAERATSDNLESIYTSWAAPADSQISGKAATSADNTHKISSEISEIRKGINAALESTSTKCEADDVSHLTTKVNALEKENKTIKSELKDLKDLVHKLQMSITKISNGPASGDAAPQSKEAQKPSTKPKEADEEIDLFGSDEEEDEEAAKIKEMRLKAYQEKKSKKPGPIAKSSVILDVKPWDDETNMVDMEKLVRAIEMDGLLWGASKLVPVGFGIKKLQIMCVVQDDKVSVEELQETIEANENFVQSVDIAAFNKI